MAITKREPGEAYAFFDINASEATLRDAFPDICVRAETPSNLEVTLTTINDLCSNPKTSPEVREIIEKESIYMVYPRGTMPKTPSQVPIKNLRYAMVARSSDMSNIDAANQLGDVANEIYESFGKGPYAMKIMAKIDGQYQFKE